MDIFKINRNNYNNGVLINGLTSKLWIERYLEPGEFTLTCPASSRMRELLPLGSLISHVDTREVMMVEDHEIVENEDDEKTVLTITGRSVDSFMSERIATANNFGEKNPSTGEVHLYVISAKNSWLQALELMQAQLTLGQISGADILPNVVVTHTITGNETVIDERTVQRGDLAKETMKILEAGGFGIKTVRPSFVGNDTKLQFVIHNGTDRSNVVQFTYLSGEIPKARYYWSLRKHKNSALVMGEFTSLVVRPQGVSGWDTRLTLVDAKDFDMKPTENPFDLQFIDSVLRQRANEVLGPASQPVKGIIVPSSARSSRYKYRKDYNVGDLIHVQGNYGVNNKMRVSEYVEVDDEKGEYGYPTLEAI